MGVIVKPLGFTELHSPAFPEFDIVFVHGLQGHPRKTWTYSNGKDERLGENEVQKGASKGLRSLFKRRSRNPATQSDSEAVASGSTPTNAGAGGTQSDVFWPEDLLPNLDACKQARILTYGYDSRLFDLVQKVNFSEISSQGETLLNGLARVRAECNNRPLMFVAHSLGGLLVKIALNESRKKSTNSTAQDKYDIVNSTFAVVFFGTPHRGATIADFGLRIIKVAAAVTRTSYNPNIIKTLDKNNEILKGLRKDFVDTLDYMIIRNGFESSTFQENQGLSNAPGFRGKVVEDDSSELERNDRNDHIEADHMGMCRFFGSDDPGYAMVAGEIKRHIGRQLRQIEAEAQGLMLSLEELGQLANLRMSAVEKRTEGTLEWLFTARATFDYRRQPASSAGNTPVTLGAWLFGGKGVFWITGLPGSGKSTSMRHVYESPRTLCLLEALSSPQTDALPVPKTGTAHNDPAGYEQSIWKRISLFVTNFGGQPEQRKWETMLHGFLLQLLRSRPDLVHPMKKFAKGVERERRHLGRGIAKAHCEIEWKDIKWSSELVLRAMECCAREADRPLRVLVIVDGLDELEDDNSAREAARFLENLAENTGTSSSFRVCAASRPEQHLLDVFVDTPRIEIHHHTQGDVRQHAWSLLRSNGQFSCQSEEEVQASLKRLLDYIVRNANGVFLWAHSIASLANDELNRYNSAENLLLQMEKLPKTMGDLYHRLLEQVDPNLRLKAYIALEVVLRLGGPTLETVFHAVQETELWLKERSESRCITRKPFSKNVSQANLQLFQKQLVASCRCMLQFSPDEKSDYNSISKGELSVSTSRGRAHQKVTLLHASAKEFLLRPNFLGILVPQDGLGKPIGNGHGFHLLYAQSWLNSMMQPGVEVNLDCMGLFLEQAPELNTTMSAEDRKVFFGILDDMDNTATSIFGDSWISHRSRETPGAIRLGFLVPSFLAWAIASGMHEYVVHRISQQSNRPEFLNNRCRRKNTPPLLHFTSGSIFGQLSTGLGLLHWPRPQSILDDNNYTRFNFQPCTFQYLIEQGADINAVFEEKTAIRYEEESGWQPSAPMTSFLLEHGADPNISVQIHGTTCPYLHLMVSWEGAKLSERLQMVALLHKHSVDFNKPDEDGVVFAEKLYRASGHFPHASWVWVLKSGTKITRSMVSQRLWGPRYNNDPFSMRYHWRVDELSRLYGDVIWPWSRAGICGDLDDYRRHDARDILRLPEFRRREWYTEEAAEAAEEMEPGWFLTEDDPAGDCLVVTD